MVVSWASVSKATGYRLERRPAGESSTWRQVAALGAAGSTFTDDLVGEGRTFTYRVTPLRHRLVGGLGSPAAASVPAPTGPAGC